jgi:hypothetical protein
MNTDFNEAVQNNIGLLIVITGYFGINLFILRTDQKIIDQYRKYESVLFLAINEYKVELFRTLQIKILKI